MSDLHPEVVKVRFERTFCMIKPDGVMRGLTGDIIGRIERAGLKIVAMKMLVPTEEQIHSHYPMEDAAWVERLGQKTTKAYEGMSTTVAEMLGTDDTVKLGQDVAANLASYMTSGPVVCMVVEGVQAIAMVRKLAGNTLPFLAEVGTIRGDYSVDSPFVANAQHRSIHNLFHASENAEEATQEIKLWFGDETIHKYRLGNENTLYEKYY